MQEKKFNAKSFAISMGLVLVLLLVFYSFAGILISGPVLKNESEETSTIAKIHKENKKIENIEKHVFQYVTYTGETNSKYIFFDVEGSRLALRDKEDALFEDVKKLIDEKYPSLKGVEIEVGYGKTKPAYIIEKGYELLVLDYDDLDVVFYMKEGE